MLFLLVYWGFFSFIANAQVQVSAGPDQTICPGQTVTLTANILQESDCSDITGYYQVNNSNATCLGYYGVLFQRESCVWVDGAPLPFNPWTAGSDLYMTEFTNGTAIIEGSIINTSNGQTGQLYLSLSGKSNNGEISTGACYVENIVNVSHYYTSFSGTVTVGGEVLTIEEKWQGTDVGLGDGVGGDGSLFGLGAWTAGTFGGCSEVFMNLAVQPLPQTQTNLRWIGPDGEFISNNSSITVSEPGTYKVKYTDCEGLMDMDPVELTVVDISATADNNGPITCEQNSVQLLATGSNNSSYSWVGPNGFTSNMQNPTVNTAGIYTVTVMKDGCTAQASTTVQNDIQNVNPSASNNGPITCEQNSVQLSATGPNNSSYSWTGPNGFTSSLQSPTINTAGTYTVTVTKDGCTGQASTTVLSDIEDINPTASNNGPITCEQNSVQLSATGPANSSYSWIGPNGFTSAMQNPTVSEAGTYTVTVTQDGCTATAMTTVQTSIDGGCEYDLALIKILAPEQNSLVELGDTVQFIVKVTNQGELNSGNYTVMDRLPPGMNFVSADNAGTHNNGVISWQLSDLEAGAFIELSISATVDVLGTGKYINWAEISSDSGDDDDSTPDNNTGLGFTVPNDLFDNHNDMMQDNSPIDEDDNDFEEIFLDRGIQLLTRVMLQGAMLDSDNAQQMRADLRQEALIPTTEPYSSLSNFEHVGQGGGETTDDTIFEVEGDDAVVDWILIEVRDQNDPSVILETAAGLLQADGDVVAADGVSTLAFPSLEEGYYQVAIRHRNHLGAMTQLPVFLSKENAALLDFTSPDMETYGSFAQCEMSNGKMALWAGATNSSNNITFQGANNNLGEIFFSILQDENNTGSDINYISTGYHIGDINMSCDAIYQGASNDPNVIFFNVLSHPANINNFTNYIIESTLP